MWSGPDIARSRPLVLGKYRLVAELGHGGMADVYLAAAEGPAGFAKLIVIKRLRNLDDPQHMAMFLDEARIARRLSHPNIVQTYEIGQENGAHFIVMEYLHGPTLQRLRRSAINQRGVPWAIEIDVMIHVLEGLHYAHEMRGADGRPLHVVHRDLSPENVIVTQLGECKILDFGIAKAIDSLSHTQAGFCKGKLKNMPPEQLLGEKVDRRADVFAAGVMLWEGLSGRALWGNIGNAAIASRLAQGDLPSLAELAPGVPQELRELCARAMSVQTDGRFATALEFRDALVAYARANQLSVTRSQLAGFVEPLFTEERERIDRVVAAQLGHGGDPGPAGGGMAPLPIIEPPSVPAARTPRTPLPTGRTPVTTPGSFPVGGTVALDVASMVPPSAAATPAGAMPVPRPRRSRLSAVLAVALVLILSGLGIARLTRTPRSAAEPTAAAPWVEPPPGPAAANVPELLPAPELPSGDTPAPSAATPPVRTTATSHRRSGGTRARAARAHASAEAPPPRAVPDELEARRDAPPRTAGRELDRESPYGLPTTPATRTRHTIDRNNPWPTGEAP
jgi:serine/threonine protein kinase